MGCQITDAMAARMHQTYVAGSADKVAARVEQAVRVVRNAAVFAELQLAVAPHAAQVSRIRCLALGSVSKEAAALHQYALLLLLVEVLGVAEVSLWDPAFDATDLEVFAAANFSVEETVAGAADTFYFMPHVPVEVLETVIRDQHPHVMLTNNMAAYSFKWTEAQLYETFRHISLMKHRCEGADAAFQTLPVQPEDGTVPKPGFSIVGPRKNRKNRRNRTTFAPPIVNYDYTDCYYTSCESHVLVSSQDLNGECGTAFSDLALYAAS